MSHLTTDLFNSLYRKHYEQLFYYAYGFTDDAEVCRDILADVFESFMDPSKKNHSRNGSQLPLPMRQK